jgi:ATP-dependent helicase/nuclease subunit B
VARLLRRVALMEQGLVVFPALDLEMPEAEWDLLGPHEAEPGRRTPPNLETSPAIPPEAAARADGVCARRGGAVALGRRARCGRSAGAGDRQCDGPAAATPRWQKLPPAERRLSGVRALEVADPAEEAQAIALALREALETPGRTAALVTPDRGLARRVAAHLRRWDIAADDSAGRPLSQTPPGTFLLAVATAAAERFAPVALLTLLGHPLTRAGEERLEWLDGLRLLDLALRGRGRRPSFPASAPSYPKDGAGSGAAAPRIAVLGTASALLAPLEAPSTCRRAAACGRRRERQEVCRGCWLRSVRRRPGSAETMCGGDRRAGGPRSCSVRWKKPAITDPTRCARSTAGGHGAHDGRRGGAAALRAAPAHLHLGPDRGALQQADLMILAGLNEGTWPSAPAPDRGWRRESGRSSACRRWSAASGWLRTISPARSAARRCW